MRTSSSEALVAVRIVWAHDTTHVLSTADLRRQRPLSATRLISSVEYVFRVGKKHCNMLRYSNTYLLLSKLDLCLSFAPKLPVSINSCCLVLYGLATTVNRRRRRHRRCHGLKRKLRNSMICCENDLLSVTLHYG